MTAAHPRRRVELAVGVAAAVVGIVAEWVAYDASAAREWAPDLAVGWGLVAAGLVGRRQAPRSRCGLLLCGAGLTWFAGNFAGVDNAALAWLAAHTAYLHRALLAHALVAYPRGRLVSVPRRGVVAAAYLASLSPSLATSEAAWVGVGLAVLGVAIAGARATIPAAAAFTIAVGGVPLARALLEPADPSALLLVYQAGLLASGWALVAALIAGTSKGAVVDRVVELGAKTTVRDALRRALDDPTLEVGFSVDGGYVDEHGELLPALAAPGRPVTALPPSGDAVLVHDPALSLDRGLEKAVARALRLTTDHAHLQAEAYEQLRELRSSRTRLVLARGRQRVVLARRIRETVDRRSAALDAFLTEIGSSDGAIDETVERGRSHLRGARESIAALAQGLQPPALATDGLAGALRSVAADSPVATTVTVVERRFDAAIEHAAYLVCSEALANVAKHAHASEAAVRVEAIGGRLRLEVSDDGRGGADVDGSGLRGMSARVDELGGHLTVESPPGRGTRLAVEIPLRGDPDVRERRQTAIVRDTLAAVG
jgi:signal transduction histidine kinase